MLILSRKIGEVITINDNITVTVMGVHGDEVKLGIDAPKNIKVFRKEMLDSIKSENENASSSANEMRKFFK